MKKLKFIESLGIIVSFIFIIGCNESIEEKKNKDIPINVEVQRVTNYNEDQTISYSGTIEESESIPLSFSTIGTVAKVLVSEGESIRKGQLLATLNNENSKNMYELTVASLKQAEDAYNRLLPMYKNGTLPEIKFIDIETKLQHARSMAATAKKSYDDCNLYSPADGVVGKRSIEPGMSALPNITSINIVKIEKVFARVSISENEISSIKKGDKAKIKIAALNNTEFTGIVEEIGVLADPLAHTYKIKIGIINKSKEIKPGMICNVNIEKKVAVNELFVPDRAVLVDEKGKNFVYAIDSSNNKAIRKYVQIGKLMKSGIEITSGLNNGEQVVVTGQQKLTDNSIVNIINK